MAKQKAKGWQLPTGGMGSFMVVWVGQFVSLLGTGMTRFALTIWAWELTGEATALALVAFFSFAPGVLMSPIAGAVVDRMNRKLAMMVSDAGAGVATIFIFLLYISGSLELWHLFVAGAFASVFESFQFPAYSSAVTMMVDKKHYARTSALLGIADAASGIISPVLGVLLLTVIGLQGVLVVDIVTFFFALFTLAIVFIPQPPQTEEGRESQGGGFLSEVLFGFRYIYRRPSLLGLQMVFFFINLTATFGMTVTAAMILARTGNHEPTLAFVQSAFGVGGLVGGVAIAAWGGPKRRVHGVLLGMVGGSLLGHITMGLGQSAPFWALGGFFMLASLPLINSSNQAIWQSKVSPDIQGKVFAVRRLIAQITAPVAMLIAGPLADRVFEPAMQPGGALVDVFGPLVGTGPGTGMALMFLISGGLGILVGLSGYLVPFIRNAEDILPDHVVAAGGAPQPVPAAGPQAGPELPAGQGPEAAAAAPPASD